MNEGVVPVTLGDLDRGGLELLERRRVRGGFERVPLTLEGGALVGRLRGGDGTRRDDQEAEESHASFIIPARPPTFALRPMVAGMGPASLSARRTGLR